MPSPKDTQDDPRPTISAKARFKRILWGMAAVAALCSLIAVTAIGWSLGELTIHIVIATVLGTFFTIMMAAMLMGLMFLSSGSGHDAAVTEPVKDETQIGD